jgi:hypothetical protein
LGRCLPKGHWMSIRLLSDTHPGSDGKALGVAVARIVAQ